MNDFTLYFMPNFCTLDPNGRVIQLFQGSFTLPELKLYPIAWDPTIGMY